MQESQAHGGADEMAQDDVARLAERRIGVGEDEQRAGGEGAEQEHDFQFAGQVRQSADDRDGREGGRDDDRRRGARRRAGPVAAHLLQELQGGEAFGLTSGS